MYNKKGKNKLIAIRINDELYSQIKLHATVYSNGNVSRWIRSCLKDPKRKFTKRGE